MTTSQRIIRGFRRAGVALAIPCFLAAAGCLAFGLYQEYKWREFPPAGFVLDRPISTVLSDMAAISAAAAATGIAAFLCLWLFGWVVAGFTKD